MKSLSKKYVLRKNHLLSLVLLLCTFSMVHTQNSTQFTRQQWLEDLNWVTKTLRDKHPDIFYRISKDDFERTVAQAEQKIRNSHFEEECLTAIRQVVASLRDGHTSLNANNLQGYSDIFPVRLYEFTDGIFITGIAEEHAKYIGSRVIKIGQLSAEEAFKRAGTLAYADNDFYKKEQVPLIVITCKLTYGLGITETAKKLPLLIETVDGMEDEIVLFAVTPTGANNILRGMDIGPEGIPFASAFTGREKESPLFLKHLDGNHNYWFEHDNEHKAMYVQFNLIRHQQNESFEKFYQRMFEYFDYNADNIDKFILDLRFNDGGNGPMVLPFINEIIKRENINRLGHLYTLIGRRSFSAAVLLVAEMMLHTQTLLVGEPTGAAQNMFSDMVNRGTLPNSGATLFVSSEYFNIVWPAGKNSIIPPHYPAPFSSSDFFSGADPALEAIFTDGVKAVETVLHANGPKPALNFFNEINYDWGVHKNELNITPFTFPISAKYNFESAVNNMGYDYMNQNKMEEARFAFELNVKVFPNSFNGWDSYAEYFMRTGDNPAAIQYYKKSLELNPDNENAVKMIAQLEKMMNMESKQ
ncbi:MAG: tetratricopeptide repeat protein [Gemmatimonadota bacterium]|nr:MAG: tetratricopeptide repeat protein [Gemmatimonadota bacterium]